MQAQASGDVPLSPADAADGFVHLSTHAQLEGTLRAHYPDDLELVCVEFHQDGLGAALKWEPSRNRDLFPHYYGVLQTAWAREIVWLERKQPGEAFSETRRG